MSATPGNIATVRGVDVVHWNPRERRLGPGPLRRVTVGPRKNNFGDLIGPEIVRALAPAERPNAPKPRLRLLTVGSILHFARSGDTVWGSGVNGKMDPGLHDFRDLDVRAVRGPRTRDFLRERGVDVPEVYGDPALLLPRLFPELRIAAEQKDRSTLLVYNLNDALAAEAAPPASVDVLDPRSDYRACLTTIAKSEYVVSTSLHGVVVAEALGIPARLVVSASEHAFKYEDYFLGTGRSATFAAETVEEALSSRAEVPAPEWDPQPLLAAFPLDLWNQPSGARATR